MKPWQCPQCGSTAARYAPEDGARVCESCGYKEPVAARAADLTELDFREHLAKGRAAAPEATLATVTCEACGATTTIPSHVKADFCPFCGASAIVAGERREILPRAMLPFGVSEARSRQAYKDWLHGLWFAPNALKRQARIEGRVVGVYVPYWTFDASATTAYTGQRGDDYYVTETYQTTENGRTVTRTRQVRKTRWRGASGTVRDVFDDTLVMASHSLPRAYAERLEPWDLGALVAYDPAYMSGFRAECYQVGLEDAFQLAKARFQETIDRTICRDIGGDHQVILSKTTRYDAVTFKHVLLPIWIAAYRFNGKAYRFLVNARSGEVAGERPYSWIKITLAVLAALVLLLIAAWVYGGMPEISGY